MPLSSNLYISEKNSVIQWGVKSLYIMYLLFSCDFFYYFLLMIGFQQFGYDVPWCDFFVFILLQICWAFGSVIVHFFNKFGKKLIILSSDVYLPCLSSGICLAYSSQFFAGLVELQSTLTWLSVQLGLGQALANLSNSILSRILQHGFQLP